MDFLSDPTIVAALSQAWRESRADDPVERHEEGGYIVAHVDLSYRVERWPRGEHSRIVPPSLDANNCYNGERVLAACHTHPNPSIDEAGREWEQRPSASDRRWHATRKLRGLVIGRTFVYEIDISANIKVIGRLEEVLSL